MKDKMDYLRDIAEIRSMMERSSKFRALSGWAGVLMGAYALAGAWVAYGVLGFRPDASGGDGALAANMSLLVLLALGILVVAVGTAVLFSARKARKRGEKAWNAASRRLLADMAVPLAAGGTLMLMLLDKGFAGLLAPCSLLFYGLALFNAGKFTYPEITSLGLLQIALGLLGAYVPQYGLLLWAAGFGILHVAYGIYLYFKYDR